MTTHSLLILCTLAALALYRPAPAPPQRHDFAEPHMGTLFRIELYADSKEQAERAAQAGFARVKELEALFSDYQDDSELMRLCKHAGQGPMRVSAELIDLLQHSRAWSERSEGCFDVTVGPLVQLWRRARRTRELPKADTIAAAKALVDYRHVQIEVGRKEVSLAKPKMRLDLGGIAKGYTCDAVHTVLKRLGITSALVAAGGDLVVSQRPPGSEGWVVSVAPLEKGLESPARLVLENQAISTAGDLEQYVEIQGVRYSHIVDPRTGLGLVGRRSCTVVAPAGVDADGADTAVCILGPEKGLRMIDGQAGLACLYVSMVEGKVNCQTSRTWGSLRMK